MPKTRASLAGAEAPAIAATVLQLSPCKLSLAMVGKDGIFSAAPCGWLGWALGAHASRLPQVAAT